VTRDRTLAWALFSVGLTAIVGQVLLMRELVATLYGNELLFGLILAAWLGWGAAGAALAAGRFTGRTRGMAAGLAAAALLLPAQLLLVRALRTLLGAAPGSILDLGPLVLAVVLVLAPLCLCLGALFSIGARLAAEGDRTPGWAYFWDSLGSVAGGVLFSFVFVRWLNPFQIAFLVFALDLSVALLLALHARREGKRSAEASSPQNMTLRAGAAVAIATLAVLVVAAFPLGRIAQTVTLRLEWPDAASGTAQSLLFSGDSAYGRLAVLAQGSQRIFYTDGVLAFETQSSFPEEVVHPALLAHPAPSSVLLIGGGVAGDLREILKHPVDTVTYVELDPMLIEAARSYLPAADAAILDDPRVRLVLTDGRVFVGQGGDSFDAIILDLPEPTTGALNRFYTAEFFAQARALLRPGGIFSFGLPSAENYWNPELARRNAGLYRTLGEVFPSVTVLPGEQDFFLAGNNPVEIEPGIMSERLAQRDIQTRWVSPAFLRDLLTGDRFATAQARVAEEAGARTNRDLVPLSYYYSLMLWFTRSAGSSRVAQAFEAAASVKLWWLALPLILTLLLARWKRACAVTLVVAGVGLAQMLLELVVLFAFQALHGSLYGQVSLLVTAFMAGLALGGASGNRIVRIADRGLRIADSRPDPAPTEHARGSDGVHGESESGDAGFLRRALVWVLAGMALYSALIPLLFSISPQPEGLPQVAFPLLALIGGLLGGMVFPLAGALRFSESRSLQDRRLQASPPPAATDPSSEGDKPPVIRHPQSAIRNPQSAIGGALYAADLAGGCLGALLGAALLIPILGIPGTCIVAALLALAGLLAIL
jgi:spermidine synthase